MSKLFSNYTIKNLELKNRIVMAPMCMYSAKDDGYATDWHLAHYLTRAVGGLGAIVLEATAVSPAGRITENDLGLWEDGQIEGLRRIVQAVKECGTVIGIQLNHAGRKSQTRGEILAPSPLPFPGIKEPREITETGAIIRAFREAARRAKEAGFDFIQIHGAHGYLINQFLSPLTNKRTDVYGEDRSLFLKEIILAIREVWDGILSLRISAEEYLPEGNHPADLAGIIKGLPQLDAINVSSGGVVNVQPPAWPGYQIAAAGIIRKETGYPVVAGGLITSPAHAEAILQREEADLIFLGRELLRNPYFPLQAAAELGENIVWPKQYQRAYQKR
jgi:NADPH2 dehydrogenase